MKRIIVAIDGLSSCGKSSFAKEIAKRYGYVFIDSGAMYRAVTLYAMNNGLINNNTIDNLGVISSLSDIDIKLTVNPNGGNNTSLNGRDVSEEIRTLEVSSYVSQISSISEVRNHLVTLQQKMGELKGVVMDGRDIGTVVFPNAELKIFMTASEEVRAKRRYKELKDKGLEVNFEEIKNNLSERDYLDQSREDSPLRPAHDAKILDNSDMTVAEQMEWVKTLINGLIRE